MKASLILIVAAAVLALNTQVALSDEANETTKTKWQFEIETDSNFVDYAFDVSGPAILRKSDSDESGETIFQLVTYSRIGRERSNPLADIPSDASPSLLGYVDNKVLIKYADEVDGAPVMVFVTYLFARDDANARKIGELIVENKANQRVSASLHPNGVMIRQVTWNEDGSRQIKAQILNLRLKRVKDTVSNEVAENQHVVIEPALYWDKPKGFFIQSLDLSEDWERTTLNLKMTK